MTTSPRVAPPRPPPGDPDPGSTDGDGALSTDQIVLRESNRVAVGAAGAAAVVAVGVAGAAAVAGGGTVAVALGVAASFVSAVPLLGPLGSLLHGMHDMAEHARFNKQGGALLAQRANDVQLALADLLPALDAAGLLHSASLASQIGSLHQAVAEAYAFMERFQERGCVSRMLKSGSDGEALHQIDKRITDVLSAMNVSLGAGQLQMQARLQAQNFSQMADLRLLVEEQGGAAKVADLDEEALGKLADVTGVPLGELRAEMQSFAQATAESLGRLDDGQGEIKAKLDELAGSMQEAQARQDERRQSDDAETQKQRQATRDAAAMAQEAALAVAKAAEAAQARENRAVEAQAERELLQNRPKVRIADFWNLYFDSKEVEMELFVPVFEEEFLGGVVLDAACRKALEDDIDTAPKNGHVHILEMIKWFRRYEASSHASVMAYIVEAAKAAQC